LWVMMSFEWWYKSCSSYLEAGKHPRVLNWRRRRLRLFPTGTPAELVVVQETASSPGKPSSLHDGDASALGSARLNRKPGLLFIIRGSGTLSSSQWDLEPEINNYVTHCTGFDK
jgi:hypothetical protein